MRQAGQAGRSSKAAQLAHQGRIGAVESQLGQLAVQHAGEHVMVVGKARVQVVAVGLQTAGRPLAFAVFLAQMDANRLAVAAGVAGDGRDRPSPFRQGVNLHVILLCEHPLKASRRIAGISTRDRRAGPRRKRAPAPAAPPRTTSSATRRGRCSCAGDRENLGNSGDPIWGELRDRAHPCLLAPHEWRQGHVDGDRHRSR